MCMWVYRRHLAPALFGLLAGMPNRSPSAVLEGSHAPFGGATVFGRGGCLRPLVPRAAAAALFSVAFLASRILLSGSRTGAVTGGECSRLPWSSHRGLLGRVCPACSRAGGRIGGILLAYMHCAIIDVQRMELKSMIIRSPWRACWGALPSSCSEGRLFGKSGRFFGTDSKTPAET